MAAVVVGLACPIVTAAMALTINGGVQYVKQSSAFVTTVALEPFYIAGGVGGLIAGRLLASRGSERKVMTLAPWSRRAAFSLLPRCRRASPGGSSCPASWSSGRGSARR